MADEFLYKPEDRDDPASNGVELTPNDSTDLANTTRGLYVGVAGNVTVTLEDMVAGTDITFVGLAAGIVHPLRVKRLWSTGTAATSIVGVW